MAKGGVGKLEGGTKLFGVLGWGELIFDAFMRLICRPPQVVINEQSLSTT